MGVTVATVLVVLLHRRASVSRTHALTTGAVSAACAVAKCAALSFATGSTWIFRAEPVPVRARSSAFLARLVPFPVPARIHPPNTAVTTGRIGLTGRFAPKPHTLALAAGALSTARACPKGTALAFAASRTGVFLIDCNIADRIARRPVVFEIVGSVSHILDPIGNAIGRISR